MKVSVNNYIFLIFLSFFLVGCGTKKLETINKPIGLEVVLPKPKPLNLDEVKWKVLEKNDTMYFSLTPKEYERLSRNTLKIQNYVKELLETLRETEKLYKQ